VVSFLAATSVIAAVRFQAMSIQQHTFEPNNELERSLMEAQAGRLPVSELMHAFLSSQVFVLLDKEPSSNGTWDDSVSPMVLNNATGSPLLAVFTSPERSSPWPIQLPQFAFGLLTNFQWLLRGIAPNIGIVVNPGLSVGMEIPSTGVQQLRAESQTAS
jgi:hypothetical protein